MKYEAGPIWDRRVVDVDPKGRVGIIMSGGIDSWVLYNLLTNHVSPAIFNVVRKDGFDSIDRVKMLTGKEVVRVDEPTTKHSQRIPEAVVNILDNFDLDQLYTGENAGPPTNYFPEFATFDEPSRPWRIDDPIVQAPFLRLYKYHIIDIALKRNIDLSKTMSCIRNIKVPCGQCWQCREKKWGFDQLGVYNV